MASDDDIAEKDHLWMGTTQKVRLGGMGVNTTISKRVTGRRVGQGRRITWIATCNGRDCCSVVYRIPNGSGGSAPFMDGH